MTDSARTPTLTPDILIFGGGIAGLWLINRLRERGYQCLLLETGTLGGAQTLASQGIIHGGLKYALGGGLSSESEAIAGMPDRWRAAIDGRDKVDLSGLRVLADTQNLWSTGSVASRMTSFFASKMLRGRIEKLKRDQFPSALADPRFKGQVYRLDDLVVDTESLLRVLVTPVRDQLLRFDPSRDRLHWGDTGLEAAEINGVRIQPRLTILAAGEGNAGLLADAQKARLFPRESAQSRPLKMVLVKHRLGHRLYAHCIGASNKPRLTVTTHDLPDGDLVWYLGGDLAERGVDRTDAEQIAAARAELDTLFPWLDFGDARFAVMDVARAEPRQQSLAKPDNAYARRDQDLIITWPTKLTLAPDLGDRVDALVDQHGLTPGAPLGELPDALPRAAAGQPHWYRCFGEH
ncbi:MAG: FAD-dependent oxidoreductase [Alcanivorax sp.]|uniref:FAD-dependent oxidoreductase n=1 Tax=Alloalcanivorax marinus TaxID=1177169 RepID=A0A9Q3UPC0_9GAMM|nr:FAD-dependent oxidoreductase [Alloalcanivorax marinus]MBM7332985.1 FAD-dependent oxidoreductase [Alloalcanivorax marinus]MCC4309920.1 FAD-dependent oxidoreductase [Alloalcanivorax marinus]MCU5786251.1 FAD-binding oxidoreductase [Alloalcanivorax marinus]